MAMTQRTVQEVHYARTALQLLTRLPVAPLPEFAPEWLGRSVAYFPLAGLVVGVISGAILIAASAIWPGTIPALLAVLAGIAVTGALHEDGLADSADGLGAGGTPEQRLTIMKDSRVGTFGGLALVLVVGLKVAALSSLAAVDGAFALILAHMSARVVPVLAAARLPYVGDVTRSKLGPLAGSTSRRRWFAVITALIPFALIPLVPALLALGLGVLVAAGVLGRAKHTLGGVTGDILGAAEQVFEVAVLLGLSAGGAAVG